MNTFDTIWKNFKRNKRSIYSLYIFISLFVLSLFSELISNNKPIIMSIEGSVYYPYIIEYTERDFGGELETTPDYKGYFISNLLENKNNWAIFPLNPHSYNSINFNNSMPNPSPPSSYNILGTDDRGRDVLARLIYGFRLSVIFASIFEPSILLLIVLLSLFGWIGLSDYVRAEFLKGRNMDYVNAARTLGLTDWQIITKHILPNSLISVVTFLPFRISGAILILTSLDFLGLGVPPTTPSLGELLAQGKDNISAWWLSLTTFFVLVGTLLLLIFIGEGIRESISGKSS